MKGLIKYVFWLLACPVFGQAVVFTAGVNYTSGAPTHNPGKANSRIAIDTVTWIRYEHVVGTTWTATGYAWQEHSGCTAPSATPTKHESIYKTNTCSPPKMYKWTGAAWEEMGYGTGVVITANNGLYKPTTSSVRAGGPLVENTNINGKATYTLTLDSMYLVTIKANRTSGTGASRMTMGSTNLIGVDIVHYNTADLDNIGQITANFNTGNIMSLANGSLITSFTQYLSGGNYRSEWYASNGSSNRVLELGYNDFKIKYLERQGIADNTAIVTWDSITGELLYQSPDILASIFGDNWGGQTVSSTARFSGNGTSGSPLELAQQSATSGQVLKWSGSAWAPAADANSGGTVTSVAASAGAGISISGSPITTSGTLVITNTGDTNGGDDITTSTTAGGDLSGTYPNPTVDGLQGSAVSATAPTSGQVLKWNGTAWAPAADAGASSANLTAASSKVAITGGTGAVLTAATVDVTEANLTLNNIGGTLGIAKGGTNMTAVGVNGTVLGSDGSAALWLTPNIVTDGVTTNFTRSGATLTATVPPATFSAGGIVTTSSQTFSGAKIFSNFVNVGGGLGSSATSSFAAVDAVGVADAAYNVVTTTTTLDHTYNFVAIGTLSNNRTMNLPSCTSTRDGWEYRFLKTGSDIYTVTIDPNGSETFTDGTFSKVFDGQNSGAFCKCRWDGGAGTWFYSQSFAPSQVVYTSTPGTSGQTLRHDGSVWQPTSNLYSGAAGIGIFTASPAQTLHVQGTARITGSDGTATGIMGRDADGDISGVSLNSRLEISGGALDIAQQSATSGQVLKWSGTAWTPASDAGATAANLTAASSKVAITGGTGAVLNAATVDVTEANLSLSSIGGTLGVGQIANGTTGSFLRSGASVPAWETAASLQGGLLLPSGTSGQTLRYGSAWTANSLLYNDGTNIGVNTTSPAQKLDVNGEMSVNGVLFGKGPGSGANNVRIGVNALVDNVSGYNNLAIGSESLSNTTTGFENVGVGSGAMQNNTSGNGNVAIGGAAMYGNTSGFKNVGVGLYALIANVAGAYNTGVGVGAMQNIGDGDYNTGVGGYALYNVIGNANVGIGLNAGNSITSGDYNIVIGGSSPTGITTGSNNVVIGGNMSGLTSSLSNNIILADGAGTQRIRILSDGKTGIGTTTPAQTLHVAGTARITGSDGTATGLMGRDADGDVSGVGLSVGLEFSGGNIQADIGSGLNISGNDIAWGGTLTENTTVDVDGFDLEFVGLPTATTEEDVMLVGTGGLLVKGTIPITAIRAPGEATYSGANGATGETVTWQPEDVNVDADPTAGHLTVELNGGMYTGVHYSLFGCCNLTYNIILSGTMKLTGEYGTVSSYTLTAGQHLEVVKFSDNSFRVSKK